MEILSDVISIALTALVGFLSWLLQKNMNKKDNMTEAMILVLRTGIKAYHSKCMKQNYITTEDYEYISDVYAVYKKLNGNGLGDKMMSDIQKLEMRDE